MIEQTLQWHRTAETGLPPCDGETVFVGKNSAGYCGCFNHLSPISRICFYVSPEETVEVISDLTEWARLSP